MNSERGEIGNVQQNSSRRGAYLYVIEGGRENELRAEGERTGEQST